MASLKEIRTRLSSVKSTRQITSAMKMVAAAKLRKAQDRIVKLRPYAGKLNEILKSISLSLDSNDDDSSFGRISEPARILVIVVTSNRGLCGAFNANVIREVQRVINDKYPDQKAGGGVWLLAIGKKGADFLRRRGYQIWDDHSEVFNDLTFQNVSDIAERVMNSFLNREFDRIEFVYNQFRNAATQDLTNEVFLPVEPGDVDETEDISDYIYEPSRESIMKELIPKTLKVQFYKAVLDSYVAEHGARMTAMHMATDNATELIRDLTLEYNKARQASITNEILEVVSGAEALV